MNCDQFEQQIESDKSANDDVALQQHLHGCNACAALALKHERYRALMAALPAPALNPARAARMLRSAAEQAPQPKPLVNRTVVHGVVAASFVVVALLIGIPNYQVGGDGLIPDVLGTQYDWTQEVTIAITVPQDMGDAQLVLQLPADMSIEGYEYLSEVVWPLDLKQGRNTIVLPVLIDEFAQFSDRLRLAASLVHNSKKSDFELEVTMDIPQTPSHGQWQTIPVFKKLA